MKYYGLKVLKWYECEPFQATELLGSGEFLQGFIDSVNRIGLTA